MTEPRRLTHAESARTILARCKNGALSTIAARPEGYPYGSLVSHAALDGGDPIFLLSDLAEHTKNIKRDPRASLLVTDSLRGDDPLADGRVSIVGEVRVVADGALDAARALMLEAHPETSVYIDFGDFNLYRMHVSDVRYIGGFGRMSWLTVGHYRDARPDPLFDSAAGIMAHMNEDHADALTLYAQHQGQTPEADGATMVGVDQHGMDLLVQGTGRPKALRVGFGAPMTGAGQVRKALVRMVKEAREALGIAKPG